MINIIYGNSYEGKNYISSLKKRAEQVQSDVINKVSDILEDIKNNGDKALIEYTKKFDSTNINLNNFIVSKQEIEEAFKKVDDKFIGAIKKSKENIEYFHEKQKRNSFITTKDKGVILGQTIRPLEKVGIYVPGGTAAYPSSVIMNAVPAKVAGVKNITMTTPPLKDGSINPNILVAAHIAGVDTIIKAGGAQAIGALAFGTERIEKVDKIVGPGNIFVAMAKRSVYGFVDIDMIAGPSEILIIADETADSKFLAADLMSQAEHDVLASSILVTTSKNLAQNVKIELESQIENLERKEIIKESLKNYGAIIIVDSLDEALKIANYIAPEHLEVMTEKPFEILGDIKNAGSIFLGAYSPEPLGDYMAGPNHVLPTSGTARFFSPLSVDDFIKKSSYIYYTNSALKDLKDDIIKLAETEKLTAHANSIKVRFE
ncbi:histidinol dehydrogenase [Clostridium sp. USBA 49]|uniref:histidinol dehydrogenase n=1 Tax=Clostridium sp. USBA 49 TaxID=1881060 RepID=UPI0009995938|nr:histidinol dehydrogenase [Clostridium sp. USBA 49]SKA78964.1 histidinol dehydrogenase [Clostridium sp. USBA 49]